MYYIHWLSTYSHEWCVLPADDISLLLLELVYICEPECYIDQSPKREGIRK